MENNTDRGVTARSVFVSLFYILCMTVIGVVGFTRDWTADNLFKNVMIGAVWFIAVTFMAMGWMKALYYGGLSVIVLIGLKSLLTLVGVLQEGRWNEDIIFLSLLHLGFMTMLAVVLLWQMSRESMMQKDSDQKSSSQSGPHEAKVPTLSILLQSQLLEKRTGEPGSCRDSAEASTSRVTILLDEIKREHVESSASSLISSCSTGERDSHCVVCPNHRKT